jgi:hypothetical protein
MSQVVPFHASASGCPTFPPLVKKPTDMQADAPAQETALSRC